MTLACSMAQCLRMAQQMFLPLVVATVVIPSIPVRAGLLALVATLSALAAATLLVADANVSLLVRGPHGPKAFKGKVVLVVGASRGIGAELASYLAEQGAKLILASRNAQQLQEVAKRCSEASGSVPAIRELDITSSSNVLASFAADARSIHGALDYCFIASGGSQSALASKTTGEMGAKVLELNACGCIAIGRELVRTLLLQGCGTLVAVASMAAKVASPGQAEYAAAKHAVLGYFTSVASEVADTGVRVVVACPGPVQGSGDRRVFGASEMVTKQEGATGQSKKVPVYRCCQLICDAAYHGVAEAWIARHPVLAMAYVNQYFPGVATKVLARVGPKRARQVAEGGSGYEYSLMKGGQQGAS